MSGAACWGSATLSWLSMRRRSTYLLATRHPWSCFVFLAPLLAAYEGGVLLLGGAHAQALRNGADTWLRWALLGILRTPSLTGTSRILRRVSASPIV